MQPGSAMVIGSGANEGGPVTISGTLINPGIGYGLPN
jgi:hypothetical protein